MQNSISSNGEWVKSWSARMICLAQSHDLSTREISTYTDKLVDEASNVELGQVVKDLLNHIRMNK